MRQYSPLLAAAVNGALVLLLPALALLGETRFPAAGSAVTVSDSSHWTRSFQATLNGLHLTIPLSAIAFWRTWAYARRREARQPTWWGIVEAGAVGALFVAVTLGSAVLRAGSVAGFLAIPVYAAIGAVGGLALGLLLYVAAMTLLSIASLAQERNRPQS
jgi:hypothetical protein